MSEFSDEDVIRYVLGEATPEAAAALRTRAANDKELAATLELLSSCGPTSFATVSRPPRRRRYSPTGARRIALALIAAFAASGLAWAGWVALMPKPLLEDNFNSGWGDISKWKTPRRSVKVEGGHVRLFDRGYLVTLKEYSEPIDLRFRWRWTDLAGDFHYRDELTVALRTSGNPKPVYYFEATDGVTVKLNAYCGTVTISSSGDEHIPFAHTEHGAIALPAEQWHDVRITDDGETIAVYVSGGNFGAEAARKPIISAKVPSTQMKRHIAFYNRERLASASHESWLDDIVIRRLADSPNQK